MDFASSQVFVEVTGEEEQIFQGEVEDGIASCAMEQAHIWAVAAKEGGTSISAQFAQEIMNMTSGYKKTYDIARCGVVVRECLCVLC